MSDGASSSSLPSPLDPPSSTLPSTPSTPPVAGDKSDPLSTLEALLQQAQAKSNQTGGGASDPGDSDIDSEIGEVLITPEEKARLEAERQAEEARLEAERQAQIIAQKNKIATELPLTEQYQAREAQDKEATEERLAQVEEDGYIIHQLTRTKIPSSESGAK